MIRYFALPETGFLRQFGHPNKDWVKKPGFSPQEPIRLNIFIIYNR